MTQQLRKRVVWTAIAALIAGVVLGASLAVRSTVPAAWRQTYWSISSSGVQTFNTSTDEAGNSEGIVDYGFSLRPVSEDGIECSIEVTITMTTRGMLGKPAPITTEAIDAARASFINDCRSHPSLPPSVASSFDAVIASGTGPKAGFGGVQTLGGGPFRVELPERHAAAKRFFWATLASKGALIALGICGFVAVVWLLPQWMAFRKRERRGCCVHCGYNLAGILAARCPECGRRQNERKGD